ncbi:FUSC family protein [Flammeovirga yaeyamensis]|uniref:FUSC family protein n=2 Tax=Flammeovirga yaeyamensis TaxID=367791 RepID=A0AAX1N0A3_9BACT|nr:FUSC family membrane protein [Flammeovirga yaeyamensis]MBB3700314.1 putative membrane protein (TIGR01666 family) [Flammeovirga yaeyamensis]NMF37060.1 hypothetical protein [Flammeovirga yaeyamensis]QWG00752.1 FUSC family protein [Flammeovirga yaeyamensis]
MAKFRQYISSIYFSNGLRMTWCIVFPLIIGVYTDHIAEAINLAIGALCVGLSDSPGTWQEKAKGLLGGTFINPIAAVCMAIIMPYTVFAEIYLFFAVFASAIMSIFGNRATMIGNSILVAVSLGVGFGLPLSNIGVMGVFLFIGGLWYTLNSLLLWQIRPYASIEKILGESYILMSQYFETKAQLFTQPNNNSLQNKLFTIQTKIDHQQEEVRTLLLGQRSALQGATPLGRSLILMLRASIDIFEKASATHISYSELHQHLHQTDLLEDLQKTFSKMGLQLNTLGRAIMSRKKVAEMKRHFEELEALQKKFETIRDHQERNIPIDILAEVKNIMRNFNRIDRTISEASTYTDPKNSQNIGFTDGLNLPLFKTTLEKGTFSDHLTIKSIHFRHAIRISIAMVAGMIVAKFFDLDRGYWVWLCISVILKPSFAITKQRMLARIIGTILGIIIALGILNLFNSQLAFILFLIPFGIGTFATLFKDYRTGITLLTPFILLMISLSMPVTHQIAISRVVDTCIGGLIAFLVSSFVFPEFEIRKIKSKLLEAIEADCEYFTEVLQSYTNQRSLDKNTYRLSRKKAQLANANLAVSFQNMLGDPKSNQLDGSNLYSFIAASRMLFAHIATLSANAERLSQKYNFTELRIFEDSIKKQLNNIAKGIKEEEAIIEIDNLSDQLQFFIHKTDELSCLREKELKKGIKDSPLIKELSDYVLITNQLLRVSKNVKFMGNYANQLIYINNTKLS